VRQGGLGDRESGVKAGFSEPPMRSGGVEIQDNVVNVEGAGHAPLPRSFCELPPRGFVSNSARSYLRRRLMLGRELDVQGLSIS
jgi:hypothetical protein